MSKDNRGLITAVIIVIVALVGLAAFADVPVRESIEKITNGNVSQLAAEKFATFETTKFGRLVDRFITTPLAYVWQQILVPEIITPLNTFFAGYSS